VTESTPKGRTTPASPRRADRDAPFLVAARGGRPTRRPLWIMRQAGRYLPEYRQMRERYSFLELCHDAEAAAEVTLQPLRRFDLDAAILFTDLLIPLEPMGIGLEYKPGPVLARTIGSAADLDGLQVPDPEADLGYMLDTVRRVRAELDPKKALIGFVGAPFTMACYLVEGSGSKNWDRTRAFAHRDPEGFAAVLDFVTEALEPLTVALVQAGCDAVQVFDSWASVLDADTYRDLCRPRSHELLAAIREAGAVAIDYVNGVAQHLPTLAGSPAHMLAVDWRLPMRTVRGRTPESFAIQGNLDPAMLFASDERLRAAVRDICAAAGPSGHVFNLGHGITPDVDPQKVALVVDTVHAYGRDGKEDGNR
jgi:uroporphyrinogen decarboxylase